MLDGWWIEEDLEGSAHDLIKAVSRYFAWRDWGKLLRSSGQPVSKPRFKLSTSRIEIYSITFKGICWVSSSYFSKNTLCSHYKDQSVNGVQDKHCCLFWKPFEIISLFCDQNTKEQPPTGAYLLQLALYLGENQDNFFSWGRKDIFQIFAFQIGQ
jgi:hypothetical protein